MGMAKGLPFAWLKFLLKEKEKVLLSLFPVAISQFNRLLPAKRR